MTDCDKALLVQAEFDGELDAADAVALAAHRAACPICQRNRTMLAAARNAMREGAAYHRASAEFRRAVEQQFSVVRAPSARPRLRWWREVLSFAVGAAVAASLVLAVRPAGEPTLLAALVDDHVRALQPGHLTDVVSTDRHTVKPWFEGKLDFAPPVKDLANAGFPLVGGRLDYLGGRAIAALAYMAGKHPVDLFIWPATSDVVASPTQSTRNGFNLVHWNEGGMTFWAVSDVEPDQLEAFVRVWRSVP